MNFLKFFQIIMQLFALLSPFFGDPTKGPALLAALEKAITDAKAGNFQAVVNDLQAALVVLEPAQTDKIESICS